jgi:hypothetical protein
MNHPTPVRDYLSPEVQAGIRQRIALAARHMENLFFLACAGMLILIPVLFAVAQIAADGAAWNLATGEPFNPALNVISAYAWRSPAGRAMAACMAGFAFVLGFISWHAAKRGPGFFSWLAAVSAAIAMAKRMRPGRFVNGLRESSRRFRKVWRESCEGGSNHRMIRTRPEPGL